MEGEREKVREMYGGREREIDRVKKKRTRNTDTINTQQTCNHIKQEGDREKRERKIRTTNKG